MLAPALLGVAAFIVNIGMNLLFIRSYGFLGAPIATTVARCLFCLGSVAILAHSLHCQRHTHSLRKRQPVTSYSSDMLALTHAQSEEELYNSGADKQAVEPGESFCLQAGPIGALTLCNASDEGAQQPGVPADASQKQIWQQAVSWHSFRSFLKLAVPGAFMVAMEAGSFDVATMFAGTLGVAQVLPRPAVLLCALTSTYCVFN
jgi:Na+-driven multidrug efflux pump